MAKVIIAGSRTVKPTMNMISRVASEARLEITEVVCGCARGADTQGRVWAEWHDVPVALFPADWNRYGASAGLRRNNEMADYADALLAFWDGKSRGTKHMIEAMRSREKPVHIQMVQKP